MPEYAVVSVYTSDRNKRGVSPYLTNLNATLNEEEEDDIIKKKKLSKRFLVMKAAGFVSTSLSLVNSSIGSYTGNKVRQYNNQQVLKIGALGVGAIFNPALAAASTALLAIRQGVDLGIRVKNSEEQSNYRRSYLGDMATSGSRWRGGL